MNRWALVMTPSIRRLEPGAVADDQWALCGVWTITNELLNEGGERLDRAFAAEANALLRDMGDMLAGRQVWGPQPEFADQRESWQTEMDDLRHRLLNMMREAVSKCASV